MPTYFGKSATHQPENITFDLRHLRYPIEYTLNPSKIENKEDVEKKLVDALCDAIQKTTKIALIEQSKKVAPFLRWKQWSDQFGSVQKFHSNPKIDEVKKSAISVNAKESIRILGLSGIGKTRILLESYRPNDDDESILRSSKLLYHNCDTNPSVLLEDSIQNLIDEKSEYSIILDNCSATIHRRISRQISQANSCLSLISVSSNPEELTDDKINSTTYIAINQEDLDTVVDSILATEFPLLEEVLSSKIKSFSQGIPMMASLLGESLRDGETFIGRLDDRELLTKILGERATRTNDRNYLRTVSLFKSVGYFDDKKSQVEYLAQNTNITPNNGECGNKIIECYDVCNHYINRNVIERNGRYISVRPFPLAIYLAQEWLEPCTPERLTQVISDLSSLESADRSDLLDSICERMKYLGFMRNAVDIVNKLVGDDGPFFKAEVITTELGSRLFRSFVEVNPIAVSNRITSVIDEFDYDELIAMTEARRGFVRILEKTCFDKRTFEQSAKAICKLSIAENESWSNNATGVFTSLFKIHLPGTEVDLRTRLQIIDWGISRGQKYWGVILRAIDSALDTWHFQRTIGAERQGTKLLKDYEPTISEIQDYHRDVVNRLQQLLDNATTKDAACKILANKTRSINSVIGFGEIFEIFQNVCTRKNFEWPEGKKALNDLMQYDKPLMTAEVLSQVATLLNSLTKDDFASRYRRISSPNYLESNEILDSDAASIRMRNLAEEFSSTNQSWDELFQTFIIGNYYSSLSFGRHLGEIIGEHKSNEYVQISLSHLNNEPLPDNFNPSVICGLFSSINLQERYHFLRNSLNNHSSIKMIPLLISHDADGKQFFDILYELMSVYEASNWLKYFRHSNALFSLEAHEIIQFSQSLTNNDASPSIALEVFEILFSVSFNKKDIKATLLPEIKRVLRICISNGEIDSIDQFKLSETIIPYLREINDSVFAIEVNAWYLKNPRVFSDDYAKTLYSMLFDKYFSFIWPEYQFNLLNSEFFEFHAMQRGLGARIGSHSNVEAVFSRHRIRLILDHTVSDDIQTITRIATMIPIFKNNNSDLSGFSESMDEILSKFGNAPSVLNALHTNMENYTWVGSVIPLCEAKITAFKAMQNNYFPETDDWINRNVNSLNLQIADERRKQEEAKRWDMN